MEIELCLERQAPILSLIYFGFQHIVLYLFSEK